MSSTISRKYPTFRDIGFKTGLSWLDGKRADDRAENLWRVHDGLYDLTSFIDKHPGGRDWLTWTKGTDITEFFEAHHISPRTATFLETFKVRDAKEPRNYKFTFSDTGFYRTLKRKVHQKLKTIDRSVEIRSKITVDCLFAATVVLAICAVKFTSTVLVLLSGLSLTWTIISSHNFFHRKENWRMYYFNLGGLNYKDWRISHALSHHIYTNSNHDLEISYFEPFLNWMPKKKSFLQKYGAWIYGPIIYLFMFAFEFLKRVLHKSITGKNVLAWDDLVTFIIPLIMYFVTGASAFSVIKYWLMITISASFCFGAIGLNAAHHHPEITHEGDAIRPNPDWGIYQLDTVMDRETIKGSPFLVLTNFGEHALHHLFPTLDHAILPQLHGLFYETLDEFDYEIRECSWYEAIIGQHRQLLKETVNVKVKGLKGGR